MPEPQDPDDDGRPIVLFLGRLGERKGVMELIRAFATVAKDFPGVDLVCAGDGDIAGAESVARDVGLGDRVRCPGWLRGDDKHKLLQDAIVFALPSHAEGLPMALLEAMATGLPVLATHVGGIPEVVRHGVEGYLVEPGDVDALAMFLRVLLEDEPGRRRVAAAARQRIEASYSLSPILERLESIYQSIH
jgi:glycosyltransferase involved in cell wall biosynthesis